VEHPHVVRIHDFGLFEGRPYIAMSHLEGPTLHEIYKRLRAAGPPPFGPAHHAVLDEAGVAGEGKDTAALVRRIAALLAGPVEALELYHIRGIVHRDIKPGNLLLDEGGRLVLTDFDLAKRIDTQFRTAPGSALGTPAYMSPEQWDPLAPEVDRRADVYALGAVLYEAFTGRPPFYEPDDPTRLMRRVLQEAPPDPRGITPDLPDEARLVALKALEKRREDRYPSAGLLAEDLRALASGGAVRARPVPRSVRAARFVWERKGRIALVLAVVAATALWLSTRPGTLFVTSVPHADAFLDGKPVGRTPVRDLRVAAGRHTVRLERRGFRDRTSDVHVAAGATRIVEARMEAADENDPAVLEALFEFTGIRPPSPKATTDRSPADGPIPVLPRGRVRRTDLTRMTVEWDRPAEGRLLLWTSEGKEIWSAPAAGREAEFPGGVRDALALGRYRWGIELPDGTRATAEFELVEAEEPELPATVRAGLAPAQAKLLRIGLLAQHGLDTAAIREAAALPEEKRTKAVTAYMLESIERLGLENSRAGAVVRSEYASKE
jgi:hypothetical protein